MLPCLRSLTVVVAWALAMLQAGSVAAEDGPAPAPAPDPESAASLAKAAALDAQVVELYGKGRYAEATPLAREVLALRERSLGKEHLEVASALQNLAELERAQGALAQAHRLLLRAVAIHDRALEPDPLGLAGVLNNLGALLLQEGAYGEARLILERALSIRERALAHVDIDLATSLNNLGYLLQAQGAHAEARPLLERALSIYEALEGPDHPDVAITLNNLGIVLTSLDERVEARAYLERALAIREKSLGAGHPDVAMSLNNLASLLRKQGELSAAGLLLDRAVAMSERALGPDHPDVATALNNLGMLLEAQGRGTDALRVYERSLSIYQGALGEAHPMVATSMDNLAGLLVEQGALARARSLYERALAITYAHAHAQLSAMSARQRLGLLRSTRYRLDMWIRFCPAVGLSGYGEVLRFRGLVARAESAERILSRRASSDDRRAQEALRIAQGRSARLANDLPSSREAEARAAWQRAYADASADRERLTRELTGRLAPLRVALERLDLGLADVQALLGLDTLLVDLLRVGDRYFAWVVRARGEPVRIDVGAADTIEQASRGFLAAIADDREVGESGAALRSLVWAPIEAQLGDGVERVVICPDAALAALPFAALPGRAPGSHLLDDLAISYVMNAQDLVPWKDAPPAGIGALLVGGVDYARADAGTQEQPLPEQPVVLAALDRAPRGGTFPPIPQTRVEVEGLRDRLGRGAATMLLGADATEARVREGVKRKKFVHIATHGFAREDLLAGLYSRKIEEAWTSADVERQLSAGHDPMLLSGLAMAGANPREGAAGDDGILTALEASYLDLDGVDLVTLSACETAKGTAESGEGVQGLVQAFQMAGARRVIASLWKVDDEATRRLMEGVYERLLRTENPLAPADALREAALALRDSMDASGKARFAAPRYWAAFVAYGR